MRVERDMVMVKSPSMATKEALAVIAQEALEHLDDACDLIDSLQEQLKETKHELQYCGARFEEVQDNNRQRNKVIEQLEIEHKVYCPRCKVSVDAKEVDRDRFHTCRCRVVPYWSELKRQIHRQAEQLAARDWAIQNLEPFARFYGHIKSHLESGQVVICKICGKSMQELEQARKEGE